MKYVLSEEFFEAVLNKPSAITEAKEAFRLENIKHYIEKYRGKRGRPNRNLQIIDAIDKLEDKAIASSPVIKYTGLILKNMDTGVDWTSDDIIAAILGETELVKEYANKLGTGGDIKAKEIAQELAKEIIEQEKEKHAFMQEFYKAMKSGTHKMVHQLNTAKFNAVESAIIRSFQLYTSLLNIFFKSTKEKMFQHLLDDLNKIVVKKNNEITYYFINQVISGLLKIGAAVKQVLIEDKPRGYEPKVSEIDALNKTLQEISGENYMLWPETEEKIASVAELSKYMQEVKAYRVDAEKIISKYARRQKILVPKDKPVTDIWNEAKIKALVNRYIREKGLNESKGTSAPHIKVIIDLAEKIIKENPTLAKYYKITSDEAGVDQLVTKISEKITRYVPFEIRFGLEDDK